MSDILNGEDVLFSIKSHKNIKTSTIIVNIFANLISRGVAGRVTNDFKLILTHENLYVEATGYSTWGGLPETINTEKINREDIKFFEVENENSEEIITITTTKNKKMTFIRDNEKNDNLGLEMSKLISRNKEN
jgi:hypothetical protein